jgi:hypothetical protein
MSSAVQSKEAEMKRLLLAMLFVILTVSQVMEPRTNRYKQLVEWECITSLLIQTDLLDAYFGFNPDDEKMIDMIRLRCPM